MTRDANDTANTQNYEKDKATKNKMLCLACLDSRIMKGSFDLSLDFDVNATKLDDLYFKDDRMTIRYSEIVGGLCGNGGIACTSMENYSDWKAFPAITNKNPFPTDDTASNLYLIENSPDFYEIVQNNTEATVEVKRQGNSKYKTSSFLARDFKLAPVYALLLSLDTKTNTDIIQNVRVMTEKANPAFNAPYVSLQIALFFALLVGFICASFDHSDVKYRKWMPASKSLLFIMMLQLFGSPIYKILFTLFEMDVARSFGLASQVFLVLIEILHFFLWMDSFFYEHPAGTVADVLTKSLVTSLSFAHLIRRICQLLKDHHFVMSFGPASFYIDTAYFSLAAIYCLISVILLSTVIGQRSQHSLDQEIEMTTKPETEKKKSPATPKPEDGEEEAFEEEAPLPNYQQMSKFLATSSVLTMYFFFGTIIYDHFFASNTTILFVLGTQFNVGLFDIIAFTFCAPNGLEFNLEDEEIDFKDDYGEEETYDNPPVDGGFLKNLKASERHKAQEPQKEFDEIDVDVDVEPDSDDEGDDPDEEL